MSEEKVYPDPTPVVRLEIFVKKGPNRISLELDEKAALSAGDQIQKMANSGKDGKGHFEDENVAIWLVGSLKWESEEQFQYHLKKRQTTDDKFL